MDQAHDESGSVVIRDRDLTLRTKETSSRNPNPTAELFYIYLCVRALLKPSIAEWSLSGAHQIVFWLLGFVFYGFMFLCFKFSFSQNGEGINWVVMR